MESGSTFTVITGVILLLQTPTNLYFIICNKKYFISKLFHEYEIGGQKKPKKSEVTNSYQQPLNYQQRDNDSDSRNVKSGAADQEEQQNYQYKNQYKKSDNIIQSNSDDQRSDSFDNFEKQFEN